MKNKIITIFLIIMINLSSLSFAFSDEFIFNVTDLEILENNTVYKGNNRGKVVTDTQVELISDNFVYLKKINRLETNGNVQLTDIKSNVIINAEQMFYLKSEEIVYTVGKTLINVDGKYDIEGNNITFLKNKMILLSNEKTTITDVDSNFYKLDQFRYSINEEVLKGDKVYYKTNSKENKEDEHYFETGFFNLKKNEFLGKNTDIIFHKTLFEDEVNDPRINAAISYGDEYNTYFEKAVFTSCKKTDNCPPWKMIAKKVRHDKIKKQIIYSDAWLELYDYPVAYFPKFFHPDPSVSRQSGILRPALGDHDTLGDSIYLPYFFVISDEKDITLKPRLFDNRKVLQTEYRQETKNSLTIIDSSVTTGHSSKKGGKTATRSHLFANTKIDLDLKKFVSSDLEIQYEQISNDTYLKLYDFIQSPLWLKSKGSLESKVKLDLAHEDYDFGSEFRMYQSLAGRNSDRYSYVLPTYTFSKNIILSNFDGSFSFGSSGSNTINNTNITTTSLSNNLNYQSFDYYSANGIIKNVEVLVKNINAMSDNSVKYKNTPQSELMSAYVFNTSFPLKKDTEGIRNTIIPKLSFRISPHDMKNHSARGRRINVGNVFSSNRLSLGDSFETGESITLGIDFKKERVSEIFQINELDGSPNYEKEKITEIVDYFDFKLATVLRSQKEKNIPVNSTINEKGSNIFGLAKYTPNKNFILGYDFSLTNDFSIIEHHSVNATYVSENFSTKFSFVEEAGILGDSNVIANTTEFIFKDYHNVLFSTRRNRKLNLTEYYNIVYEYKNDCLIAGIKYRKDYYNDKDIIPKENLFFSITIIPFYTFSPDKMILNKNRID